MNTSIKKPITGPMIAIVLGCVVVLFGIVSWNGLQEIISIFFGTGAIALNGIGIVKRLKKGRFSRPTKTV